MTIRSFTRLRARVRGRRVLALRPADPLPQPVFNCEAELQNGSLHPASFGDDGPWWRTAYGRWRFTVEAEAMRRFPGFRAALSEDGFLVWQGSLESGLRSRRYLVRVIYPHDFPEEAPVVTIVRPRLPEAPHLLSGQRPCLYRPENSRVGYDPARTTAATLVAWTALWIHAFETWHTTGEWPGKEE